MTKHYIAVTYDVCEHNDLCEEMNEYSLDGSHNLDEQVTEYAREDIAPLVKVFELENSGVRRKNLYKEYRFEEYACDCDE